MSQLLAQLRHDSQARQCPVLRQERTQLGQTAMSHFDPGCVKTHTSAKCGKYNSPTRYRAICAQHDLALMMRNFSNMFLRARRALEFSHGLDPKAAIEPSSLLRATPPLCSASVLSFSRFWP